MRRRRASHAIRDKCQPCKEFERRCMAHFEVFAQNSNAEQRVVRTLLHPNFEELIKCGASGCHLCRCWSNSLLAECTSISAQEALVKADVPIHITSPFSTASSLRQNVAQTREAHYFEVHGLRSATLRLGGISAMEFRGLTAISSVQEASKWALERLETCHRSHRLCKESSSVSLWPTRLLHIRDPELVSLVDGKDLGDCRYLAVSYCWGGDQETKLFEHNREQLKAGIDPACLSRTIQEAIRICSDLRIEFLWVDALCIIQESDSDWSREASLIHHVYGGAYVTLSVGSSDKAIDGFLGGSKPMFVDAERCSIIGRDRGSLLPVMARKTLAHIRTDTPPAQRGWIFQEELLSPRIIYWTGQGLFWSCCTEKVAQNGTHSIDELFPQFTSPAIMDAQDFRTNPDPLWLWDDMISSLSKRDFTIASDKLPAVKGLASLIQQRTGEEYIWGFWRGRLPAQLLWTIKEGSREQSGVAGMPSWSWAVIAPACEIVMPKQGSSRATFKGCIGSKLRLRGRTRPLTMDLSPLWSFPEEESGSEMLRYTMLEHQPNIWAVDHETGRVLICLDWQRPIMIQLDRAVPLEESFEHLICLEVSYFGLLLLEPAESTAGSVFRRIGCAQVHREASFFEGMEEVDVEIV